MSVCFQPVGIRGSRGCKARRLPFNSLITPLSRREVQINKVDIDRVDLAHVFVDLTHGSVPHVKPRQAKELYSPRAVAAILSHPRFAQLQALVSRCIKVRNERLLFGLAKSAVLN